MQQLQAGPGTAGESALAACVEQVAYLRELDSRDLVSLCSSF